jgi:hypothetical protein
MKTHISRQHTNVIAVQPLTTFHKEDRMKTQSSNTLKLAIVFAMAITMTLSAVAQNNNPNQVALFRWYAANQVITFSSFYDSAGTAHALSQPNGMAFDGENMWISETSANTVLKVNASDGRFVGSYTVTSPGALAFDGKQIWVNNVNSNTVTVLRASDGRLSFPNLIPVPSTPKGLIWDGWTMWEVTTDKVGRMLWWNNGGFNCIVPTPTSGNTGVAFDGYWAWVSNSAGHVYKYDGTCTPGSPVSVSGGPVGIVYDGTAMWTANSNGTVARITPGGSVSYYSVGGSPQQIAFDGANIWVTLGSAGTAKKIVAFGSNMGTVSALVYGPCDTGGIPVGLAFDGASMWTSCTTNSKVAKM